jgi:alkylation response protein AidB-like acyl-CoA dehydrogenase
MDSPGIDIHPVHTFPEERTNATFYSDVRIPDEYRISPVDGALEVMAWVLGLEQGGGGFIGPHKLVVEAAVAWAKETERNGKPVIENERVLERLAQAQARSYASHAIYYRSLWMTEQRIADRAAGPMSKLFASEAFQRDSADLLELAAPDSLLRGKHHLGFIEIHHRHAMVTTTYGGTSEVHRSQVAENSFGLPKSR